MGRDQAKLRSPEALARVRAALIKFAEEAASALDESDAQIGRGQQWLTREQPMRWKQVHRKATDIVNNRRSDVYRKQLQGIDRPASAVEEKKALENARQKMAEAERVLQAIRGWSVKLERAGMIYRGQAQRLRSYLSVEVPNAVGALDSMATSIEAYLHDHVPTAATGGSTGSGPSAASRTGGVAGSSVAPLHGASDADLIATLRARTPDESERFGLEPDTEAALASLEPVDTQPGSRREIMTALVHVDRKDVIESMTVILERAARNADLLYAERSTTALDGDSGWFIGDARTPRPATSDTSLAGTNIENTRQWLPALEGLLDLPPGWVLVIDRGTVIRAFAPDNRVAWDTGSTTVPLEMPHDDADTERNDS
jgi:hypothetical protein